MSASHALNPEIGSDPQDFPLLAAAGMLLFKFNNIAYIKFPDFHYPITPIQLKRDKAADSVSRTYFVARSGSESIISNIAARRNEVALGLFGTGEPCGRPSLLETEHDVQIFLHPRRRELLMLKLALARSPGDHASMRAPAKITSCDFPSLGLRFSLTTSSAPADCIQI